MKRIIGIILIIMILGVFVSCAGAKDGSGSKAFSSGTAAKQTTLSGREGSSLQTGVSAEDPGNAKAPVSGKADGYSSELVGSFGFGPDEAELILDLYDRIDKEFNGGSELYKAWVASRLLSEFSYDYISSDLGISFNKWDAAAGSVTSPDDRRSFFTERLKYAEAEYDKLSAVLSKQHDDKDTSDFTHMQYALAARLAYTLVEDPFFSNSFSLIDSEIVSYLAGWLGDAAIRTDGAKTSLAGDDYTADLDAENVYRLISDGSGSLPAFNRYYGALAAGEADRATVFKDNLGWSFIEESVLETLGADYDELRLACPDTYDFLMSLKDGLPFIKHY